jgi:hypothetical protein
MQELPNGEAERLLNHPLFNEIFDALESDAMEVAVQAKPSDDETRRTAMNEIRAIRSLRQKLKTRASGEGFGGKTTLPKKRDVA